MADAPDLSVVKQVQQHIWSEGDFAMVGTMFQGVSENLCEAVDVWPGQRVLDVACGSGNTTIAAGRRFADCVGVDYVPALLERARERAAAERLEIEFREGDAEALPFPDASFDVVLSTFGAMFAPDQPRTAAELLRVCRSGGRIGMGNWTPEGFVGQMFAEMKPYAAPPPAGASPPPMWGDEDHVRRLLGDRVTDLRLTRQSLPVHHFVDPEDCRDYFKLHYGPTIAAYRAIAGDPAKVAALDAALADLGRRFDRGNDAAILDWEYLLVTAIRAQPTGM